MKSLMNKCVSTGIGKNKQLGCHTDCGIATPSLVSKVPMVPTPCRWEGSFATFSRTACVAISGSGGLRTLGTSNFLFSLYNVCALVEFTITIVDS